MAGRGMKGNKRKEASKDAGQADLRSTRLKGRQESPGQSMRVDTKDSSIDEQGKILQMMTELRQRLEDAEGKTSQILAALLEFMESAVTAMPKKKDSFPRVSLSSVMYRRTDCDIVSGRH